MVFHQAGVGDEFAGKPFANQDTLVVFLDRNPAGVNPATQELNGNGLWDATNNEPIVTVYPLPSTSRLYNPFGTCVEKDAWVMTTYTSADPPVKVETPNTRRALFNATGALATGKEAGTLAAYIADQGENYGRLVFNSITGQVIIEKYCPSVPSTNKWLPQSQSNRWEWVY